MKKINPILLEQELNRHILLCGYDFYYEKKELPEYKDLILGDTQIEEEEAPEDAEPVDNTDTSDDANAISNELGVDDNSEVTGDIPEPEDQSNEPEETDVNPEPQPEESSENDVEIDVTSLVKGSEEAKHSADLATHNTEVILKQLSDLENRVSRVDQISAKIEDLEKELIKRNPTPVEKLEMRSLDSYPYSQKLSDYWGDKTGSYNVMNKPQEKKEYILTKKDVDNTYSDANIKQSFNVKKDDLGYQEDEI